MPFFIFFFFNDTATTEIYTLSLHDALPIFPTFRVPLRRVWARCGIARPASPSGHQRREHLRWALSTRSEEHTSELQSRLHLVCRLLLEKKKNSRELLPL